MQCSDYGQKFNALQKYCIIFESLDINEHQAHAGANGFIFNGVTGNINSLDYLNKLE